MAETWRKSIIYWWLTVVVLAGKGNGQLVENFYAATCPMVEAIVQQTVNTKVSQTFTTIPATLRLFFHDCFVEGCDASVMIASPNGDAEKDAPDNLSLAGDGFDTVIKAKQAVEAVCPGVVSCADVLTIAARDVVIAAGGPIFNVQLGRRDGLISQASRVAGNLPSPTFNVIQLNTMFAKHNLTQLDMIALSGAHTVGFSHCNRFANRLYSFSQTSTVDPSLDSTYVQQLMAACPQMRSKVESSVCVGNNPYDQPVVPTASSATTSNGESTSSTPNITDELKVASQLRKFNFNELKLATRSFRPESLLGEGGFGCVFKGWVNENGTAPVKPGTGLSVAVKTLNHHGLQGHKEWLAEVYFLGDLLHPNLVKLIGYCIEDDQRLLVYEFMPRGSLENHLFRRSLPLAWATRMKIALGAAKGLAFLHEEAERPVIYRDFKTSNILLDADYNAKLSDFGLAKDGPEGDNTHVSTRVMGTYGYAAPEYVMTGHLTSKSDVYSFGVVLLEMITGRRSMDKNRPNGEHNLVEWARPYLGERRKLYQIIDPLLEGRFSVRGAQKAGQLATLCLNRDPKARPLMSDVYEVLKPLVNLKDMACSSPYFQALHLQQGERASPNHGGRNGAGPPVKSLSVSRCPNRSPCFNDQPYRSHRPVR